MSETIKYLRAIDRVCSGGPSLFRLILDYGHTFTKRAECPRCHIGQPRSCYNNAALMALDTPRRYAYVEGFAQSCIPVEHAWVWDRWLKVLIDPTWTLAHGNSQPDPAEYVGLMVRAPYLRDYIQRKGRAGLVVVDAGNAYGLATDPNHRRRALILPRHPVAPPPPPPPLEFEVMECR